MSAFTVLVVDDSELDSALLQESFADVTPPPDLVHFDSGAKALEYLSSSEKLPDLVLLDLWLPGLNGHEVLEEIRANQRTQRVPVLIMSVSLEPGDISRSYELRANAYIGKPHNIAGYTALANAIRKFWLGTVRLPGGYPADDSDG